MKEVKFNIIEGLRFFEVIIFGKKFDEVLVIYLRICFFCLVVYKFIVVEVVEKVIGFILCEEI